MQSLLLAALNRALSSSTEFCGMLSKERHLQQILRSAGLSAISKRSLDSSGCKGHLAERSFYNGST